MKIFFDTEFTGLHQNTTLISLGCISECGMPFYAEFVDYDKNQVTPWVKENVLPNLGPVEGVNRLLDNSIGIGLHFMEYLEQFLNVEFWGDVCAYDWVLLRQLLRNQLPPFVCYIPFDIATLFAVKHINPDISREAYCGIELKRKHHAFDEAKLIKACHEKLVS